MVLVKPISRYGGTYWYPREAEVRRWEVQVHLELHMGFILRSSFRLRHTVTVETPDPALAAQLGRAP